MIRSAAVISSLMTFGCLGQHPQTPASRPMDGPTQERLVHLLTDDRLAIGPFALGMADGAGLGAATAWRCEKNRGQWLCDQEAPVEVRAALRFDEGRLSTVSVRTAGMTGPLQEICATFDRLKAGVVHALGPPTHAELGPCEKVAGDAVLYEPSCATWAARAGRVTVSLDMMTEDLERGQLQLRLDSVPGWPAPCAPPSGAP